MTAPTREDKPRHVIMAEEAKTLALEKVASKEFPPLNVQVLNGKIRVSVKR